MNSTVYAQLHIIRRHSIMLSMFLLMLLCSSINAAPPDFVIVVLPDTQNYSQSYPYIFEDQTQWIFDSKEALNIVYVAHEGDVVNEYDQEYQWMYADDAMSILEPDIPYGVLPGNHDQPTTFYNTYFGVSRFLDKGYYGGHYGSDNDNNYTLFSASGIDFIVINLAYDESPDTGILDWADGLLKTYSDRQGIVVSHYIIGTGNPGAFGTQGQAIYNNLKDNPNLFLMLCGHMHGEGKRTDTFNGNTIYTLLADYQERSNGGNGWLRILEFSPANSEIRVKTYSPWLDQYETDADSQFELSYTMPIFVAYNDLSWSAGQLSSNITTYTTGQSGLLKDYSTGTNIPVTLSIAGGYVDSVTRTQGSNANSGTDAYDVFNGIVDSLGLISYSATNLTFTFTGLDPSLIYEFVLFGNRNNPSYTNRMTTTTISDVEHFFDSSTPGADFTGPNDASVTINNGYNTTNGYVARFTYIRPGIDGDMLITVSSADGHFYANALMLKATPEPVENVAPVATNDFETTSKDSPVNIDIVANDADPDGTIDPATVAITGSAGHGTAVANVDGTVTYTPDIGFFGTDTFTYTVDDNDGAASNEATVTVTVAETHTITATASNGGTITPSGSIIVSHGSDQTFTMTPDTGYHIADVTVDGSSVGAVPSYTFSNIIADHTIGATFEINTYTVTPSAGANGSISPSTPQTVNHGSTTSFTVTPNAGYYTVSVAGCGGIWEGISPYTTGPITADCTVTATFAAYTGLTLLSPNGGEIIPTGSNWTIRWIAPDAVKFFKLLYSVDSGLTWYPIPKTADFLTGTSYNWTVPRQSGNKKNTCLVKVKGYNGSYVKVGSADISDDPFTIEVVKLESPNGGVGVTYPSGTPLTITWTMNATKNVAKIKLYYTKNGGLTWFSIVGLKDKYLTAGSHSYNGWVPSVGKDKPLCKVKVELKDALGNILGTDKSDSYFAIQP